MTAFEVDALASTRPIEFPVESPDDASGMFDTLTYTKGGAVLRMIEQWLGPEHVPRRDPALPRRRTRTRTPRRTTCGTRWRRRAASRSGGSWTPGSSRRGTRRSRSRSTATRSGSPNGGSPRRCPTTRPPGRCPLIVRQVFPDGERAERVLVEAEGLTVPLAHPEALVVGERRERRRSCARSTTTSCGAGSPPGTRTSRRRSVRASWTTRGPPPSRAARPCRRSWTSRPGSPARRRRRSGRRSSPGSRWCDRFLDGPPRERFRDYVRTLVRPALERLGWDPRTEDGELDRELRGDLIRTLGVLGDDPETQAMAREAEALVTHGGRRRRVGRRRRGRGGRLRRRRGGVRGVPRADAGGADAAGAGPLPIRARAVPRPRSDGAAARARRVRGDPAPGRAVPAGACRGEPGPRGDGVAPRPRPLGRAVAPLRGLQRDPSGAGRPPDHRPGRWSPRSRRSSPSTTSRRTTSRWCRRWNGSG